MYSLHVHTDVGTYVRMYVGMYYVFSGPTRADITSYHASQRNKYSIHEQVCTEAMYVPVQQMIPSFRKCDENT